MDKAGEVRLGLVLYGGVSLAIYMNGVAQEFFRAVRGTDVYDFIKEITDSDIVVDVISGTSAGGINGIFLAYALANGCDFEACAKLWREQGDIGALLRNPLRGIGASLLDSEGYYRDKLAGAFAEMDRTRNAPPVEELDLFVTGTDFYGNTHTEIDDAGHAVDVKEHRTLFHLKHTARASDFGTNQQQHPAPDTLQRALGKLAQITSAFPLAFAPVTVFVNENVPEDDLLAQWGKLKQRRHFVDGGVLANKPFTPTIEAIFNRHAEREVDRYLCYVEPDPETFRNEPRPHPPNWLDDVKGSFAGIPQYQSVSADLRSIAEHNTRIEQFKRLCQLAGAAASPEGRISLWNPPPGVYRRSRLMSLSSRAVEGVLKVSGSDVRLVDGARDAASSLVKAFDAIAGAVCQANNGAGAPQAGGSAQFRASDILEHFDVYARRRRLFYMVYTIYDKLYGAARESKGQRAAYQEVWRKVNARNKALEIVQNAMESLVDEAEFQWKCEFENGKSEEQRLEAAGRIWAKIACAFFRLLRMDADPRLDLREFTNDELNRLEAALRERRAALVREIEDWRSPEDMPPDCHAGVSTLLKHLDAGEAADLGRPADVRKSYEEFPDVDAQLFPVQLISGLEQRDLIRTVRFSPLDATGLSALDPKVLGKQYGHFGAFLRPSWRRNDILFGRLDGAAQLIRLLLSEKARQRNRDLEDRTPLNGRYFDETGNFKERCLCGTFDTRDPETARMLRDLINGCWTKGTVDKLIELVQNRIIRTELALSDATIEEYGSPGAYLQAGYPTRFEGARNLVRPKAGRVVAQGLAVAGLLILGLWALSPGERTRQARRRAELPR